MITPLLRRALSCVLVLVAVGCGTSSSSPDAPGADALGSSDGATGADGAHLDAGAADRSSNDGGDVAPDAAVADVDRDAAGDADRDAAADTSPADAGPPPMPAATCEGGLLVFPALAEIAAYSRSLDRVLVASAYHRMLYIADAEKCSARAVVLPRPAQGITVSKDGKRAVVGLDGAIVDVDLQTGAVGTPVLVPGAPQSFILDDRQGLHFVSLPFEGSSSTDDRRVGSFNLDTKQWKANNSVRGLGALVAHPAGGVGYWVGLSSDSESVHVDYSAGEAVVRAYLSWSNGQVKTCGQLAFSGDGLRAATGCGQVYTYAPGAQPTFTAPLALEGDWTGSARTRSLDFAGGRVAVARYEGFMGPGPDMEVRLLDAATGKLVKAFPTPALEGSTSRASPEGVFLREDGQRIHTLVASGSYAGLRYALASVSEAAPTPPMWPKASSGTYGGGGEYGLIRSLGGAPNLERLEPGLALPWQVGTAAFSRKRGWLALAATGSDGTVHLVDAESGKDVGTVPVTGAVTALIIDEGSDLLAVVRPTAVSLFNLETRTMVRELMIAKVGDLAFDSNGRLWLAVGTEYNRTFQVVQISTGEAKSLYMPTTRWLRPHPDGNRFYMIGTTTLERMTYDGSQLRATGYANVTDVLWPSCTPLTFRGDDLLLMSCARGVALTSATETDLRAGGSLEGWRGVTHLDVTADRVVGIGGALEPAPSVSSNGARELRVFKPPLWAIERRFELGSEAGSSPPAYNFGQFVFAARSGHRAYVIATPQASGPGDKPSVLLTADF